MNQVLRDYLCGDASQRLHGATLSNASELPDGNLSWAILATSALFKDNLSDYGNGSCKLEGSTFLGFGWFRRLMDGLNIYFTPVIILVGMVGNLLSVIVFVNTYLSRQSSSIYLASLAVADLLYLLSLTVVWLSWIHVPLLHHIGCCQLVTYLKNVCTFLSVWYVVCFTVDRYIIVCYPLRRDRYCTPRLARRVVLLLAAVALLLYAYSTVTTGIQTVGGILPVCTHLTGYYTVTTVATALDSVFTLIVPSSTIVVLNCRLVSRILRLLPRDSRSSPCRSGSAKKRSRHPSELEYRSGDYISLSTRRRGHSPCHPGPAICHSDFRSVDGGGGRNLSHKPRKPCCSHHSSCMSIHRKKYAFHHERRPRCSSRCLDRPGAASWAGGLRATPPGSGIVSRPESSCFSVQGAGGTSWVGDCGHRHCEHCKCPRQRPQIRIGQGRSRAQYRTARLLIIVSTVFVVLKLPNHVFRNYAFFNSSMDGDFAPDLQHLRWQQLSAVLYHLNFAINFFLYSVYGRQFRAGLRIVCVKVAHKARNVRKAFRK